MNELLATTFSGLIIDENATDYFVQKNGVTFRLSKKEGARQIGEAVEGFGYVNQKQEPTFTTEIPLIRKGHYQVAAVTNVRKDLGVFVDIGLPDKDIVISLDDLPQIRSLWPKVGDHLWVTLVVDAKQRIWGKLMEDTQFMAMAKRATSELHNQNINGTVFRLKLAGTYVFTEESYIGFIHPSERFQEPRLGETVQGRVIGVRPDGVLNLSVKPRAHESISDDAAMLLAFLERAKDHRIPFTDKSTPQEIQQAFGISKGQFKRALGQLLKNKSVKQMPGYTQLLSAETEKEEL